MDESYLLSPQQAVEFVKERTRLFDAGAALEVTEISTNQRSVEGYVNSIFRIHDRRSDRSVVFKQYRRYLRGTELTSPEMPLSLARMHVEMEAFKLWQALCPGCVPQIYAWDEPKAILIMEDLSHMRLARFEFARRKKFPHFARQAGCFLGRSAFYTSDLYLPSIDKKNLARRFTNPEFRELLERVIFDRFFTLSPDDPFNPHIEADLVAFLSDERVIAELLRLKEIYMTRTQSLIHNDFHTANIFLDGEHMKVFDGEAAFFGPTAYDLGELWGNLILSCLSLQVLDDISLDEKIDYEDYLLGTLVETDREFRAAFCEAWERDVKPEYRKSRTYREDYLRGILQDAAGYAGLLAMSRIYDLGMSYDFARIADLRQRAAGQRLVIRSARQLMLDRQRFERVEDVTAVLKQIKTEFKIANIVRKKLEGAG